LVYFFLFWYVVPKTNLATLFKSSTRSMKVANHDSWLFLRS
jgi:hypothetical protein